tara:strand:- start:96738 stop:97007 length:270 start_codon:yes stop_codon:yes gene_type:complete
MSLIKKYFTLENVFEAFLNFNNNFYSGLFRIVLVFTIIKDLVANMTVLEFASTFVADYAFYVLIMHIFNTIFFILNKIGTEEEKYQFES